MKAKISILFLTLSIFIISNVFGQLTILSGPEQGSYYVFVEDMKTVVADYDLEIINKETGGAAYNFDQLADPKSPYKIAMMQSDYLFLKGGLDKRDNTEKSKNLKVLFPMAYEEIHLITRASSRIKKFSDVDSSTIIAIGNKNQGTYATANYLKNRSGIFWSSRNFHFDQSVKELAMDRIDAFLFVGSAPVDKLDIDPAVMVDPLYLATMDDVNGWTQYYKSLTITTEDYKWLKEDVPTYGVRTVLVVNEAKLTDQDKELLEQLTNGIKAKYDVLKQNGHPKWSEVNFEDWKASDWPVFVQ